MKRNCRMTTLATSSTSRRDRLTCKLPFSTFFVATVFWVSSAFGSDLQDIRTGFHRTFSRIVIEFDAPVSYDVFRDDSNRAVMVEVLSSGRIAGFGEVELEDEDPILRRVSYGRNANLTSVTVFLKSAGVRIEHYTMTRPFRIVIDIFIRTAQDAAAGQDLPAKPSRKAAAEIEKLNSEQIKTDTESVSATRADSTVLNVANVPEAVLKKTTLQRPTVAAASKIVNQSPAEAHRSNQRLFWLIGGAFVLLDAMLLFLYVNRRRGTKVPPPQQTRHASQAAPAAQLVQTPPPTVDGQAFAEVLKSALEHDGLKAVTAMPPEGEVVALQDINRAVKIDSLIGSLTEVIAQPEAEPTPPDFKEIAQELELVDASGELSEEAARKQLIGRDGMEFMQNIKRLYLN